MASVTFHQFLIRRGYDLRAGTGPFLRRLFLESWQQPGFHRFWRTWNPLYGYFLYRLYVGLGGNRHRAIATLTVFACCGFVLHDLPISILAGRLSLAATASFLLFGALSLASAAAQRWLRQPRWPGTANAALNLGLVMAGLWLGAWVARVILG